MTPQHYFAKQLLPADVQADPQRMIATLSSPAAADVLTAKWAHACTTSGVLTSALPPRVVGTTAGVDWQMVVLQMPVATQPTDALYVAVMVRGSDVRFFYYELRLSRDLHTLSAHEAVLAGVAGGSRVHCGTFQGLHLEAFVAALAHVLELPGLRRTAPAAPLPPVRERSRRAPAGRHAVAMLGAAAGMPLASWALGFAGVGVPWGHLVRPLLSLVAVVLTLVWLHRTFVALRGRTRFSPGMAVGSWFIPVANVLLPALVLRDAWRARGHRGGGLVWGWMGAWWLAIIVSGLQGAGLTFFGEVGVQGGVAVLMGPTWHVELVHFSAVSLETVGMAFSLALVLTHAVAYGLLALVVHRIGSR